MKDVHCSEYHWSGRGKSRSELCALQRPWRVYTLVIDDAREIFACCLSPVGFAEEIFILSKDDSSESRCSI